MTIDDLPSYFSRRVGRFKVHRRFFYGLDAGDGVNLFHNMIVLDVGSGWMSEEVEYKAIHPSFRVLEAGEIVPEYHAVFYNRAGLPQWREYGSPLEGLFDAELARRSGMLRSSLRSASAPTGPRRSP